MKTNIRSFVLLYIALILCNCSTIKDNTSNGHAIERISTFWMKKDDRYTPILINEKVWFKDSIGITQICGFFSTINENEMSTVVKTVGYRMIDLSKKWVYEYSNLSDTAKIVRKFRYSDTTQLIGGWNFSNPKPIELEKFTFLPDTTINSSVLKQANVRYNFNGTAFDGYCRFNCQIKGTFFELDKGISTKGGCPLVYFRASPKHDSDAKFEQEIKHLPNNFTDSIKKIFIAWRQNESIWPIE